MIKKSETCIYCGEKMESITAKKKYCSSKCKLYYNREKNKVKIGAQLKNTPLCGAGNPILAVKLKTVEISVKNQKTPPKGLKGIDLTIWKSEN